MTIEVLNRRLYRGLVAYYGDVEVINPGVENSWRVVWEARPGRAARSPHRDMESAGEEYRVRCRKCRDDRARLYINHRWGVWDEETRSRNLWLANCFNENCYAEYNEQHWLFETVYAMDAGSRSRITVLPGTKEEVRRLQNMPPPGPTWRLDQLMQKMPEHKAIQYLLSRGLDPVKLGKLWNVGYCPSSRYGYAENRIIIPIHQQNMHVGWQARYVGDDVNGVPFNRAKVPKYFSCPGMPKKLIAYNVERALRHPTVVVVEGPTDVWNTGLMGIGVLGKTASSQVRELIVAGMKQHGRDGVVAVAFDAEPGSQKHSSAKPRAHPTDVVAGQLRTPLAEFGVRVVPVRLPAGSDPGSMDRDQLRELIKLAAARAGAVARFSKPQTESQTGSH